MKKKSGHRRRTKIVRKSRKNLRRTIKRKSLGKGRRRPTRRYSRVQRGGDRFTDNLDCFVTVGNIYYYGDGDLERDDDMAVKLYKVAADNGNADGQFRLGEMYRHGKGVEKNQDESVRLYKLAAAQKHEGAISRLTDMKK
jgi:TPR repeat protein